MAVPRPLPAAAIVEKFHENAGLVLDAARRDELARGVLTLDEAPEVRKLIACCR